jgi:Mg2+ and Co2+ transporter CorA
VPPAPKVEAYDGFHLIVYKTARYDGRNRRVEFGEVDIFVGAGFVIAVRHRAGSDPIRTRLRVDEKPELLGVRLVGWDELSEEQRAEASGVFDTQISRR